MANRWIVFLEHEANNKATYDGTADSVEEAFDIFIFHRILTDKNNIREWLVSRG